MLLLFYDTETTGLPLFDQPSEDPRQPHIVQLGAALVDSETRIVESELNLISLPDGWTIPDEVAKVHRIDTAKALRCGVPERVALAAFAAMWERADKRIAHNEGFDARIIRIGLKRFADTFGFNYADKWKAGSAECTCDMTTPICMLPPTDRMRGAGFGNKYKKPKLEEAYKHFFGCGLTGAHNAMIDVHACIDVYWAIKDGDTPVAELHVEEDISA